ncbi:caspase-3-like [Branchiostoma lanceolatum]|uniref:caspase-3-like n=1 Tax=Branchiostoma lanceolatum TaxID=7740 RepID=UPI00345205F7
MEAHHRQILIDNRVRLAKDMKPKYLYPILVEKKVFNDDMIEEIEAAGTRFDQCNALLRDLPGRGKHAFQRFVEALDEAEQTDLADLLRIGVKGTDREPITVPQQPSDKVLADAHPLSRPEANDPTRVYTMRARPRGIALIINNKTFSGRLNTRSGTDVDCANLQRLFQYLNFHVTVENNKSVEGIRHLLLQHSQLDHGNYDSFVLTILSHGVEGQIYGTDEHLLSVKEITTYFDNRNCKTLVGKPKLFFLQACRGDKMDRGIEQTDAASVDTPGPPALPTEEELVRQLLEQSLVLEETDAMRDTLPSQSDMLLAYATVPGFVSWRNSQAGSWFVQALTEVLTQYAPEEDLLSMLTIVNDKVATRFQSAGKNKQMPAPVTMLRKKLFFNPGQ